MKRPLKVYKKTHTHTCTHAANIPTDPTHTHIPSAATPPSVFPLPGLCYCFENMIAVTDGVGRGEGSGRAEWQDSSIVPDQCESVSIAIETGATLGRHAFISAAGSPLAIRGQINPSSPPTGCKEEAVRVRGRWGAGGLCGHTRARSLLHRHTGRCWRAGASCSSNVTLFLTVFARF